MTRRSGVTLLEILMATMIMAFAMIPIAGILGRGHEGTRKDFLRIEAVHFAETAMSEALKLPYSQLPLGSHTSALIMGSGTVNLGTLLSAQRNSFDLTLGVSAFPVRFSYQPVDLNQSDYASTAFNLWVFLPTVTDGAVFDGTPGNQPIMVKQLVVTVQWTEPNGVRPPAVAVLSYKADLER